MSGQGDQSRWIVVGGGFGGIVSAYLLARKGRKVTIVERQAALGGILQGIEWNGFRLDYGCQLFVHKSDDATRVVLELLDHDARPVEHRIASVTAGRLTEGFELPDLSSFGEETSRQIAYELICAAARSDDDACNNLAERLEARFGGTAAALAGRLIEQLFGLAPAELPPQALDSTHFHRLVFLDETPARLLKRLDVFDDRIAAVARENGTELMPSRVFYPMTGGMRAFCETSTQKLRELGVDIRCGRDIAAIEFDGEAVTMGLSDGESIHADNLLWTAGSVALGRLLGVSLELADHIHTAPMVLYYFAIDGSQVGDYCYIHDFDPDDFIYRGSAPGSYGEGTCPPGKSYACAEILTRIGSPEWDAPEKFTKQTWDELRRYRVVAGGEPADVLIKRAGSAYIFRKFGFESEIAPLRERVAATPRLHLANEVAQSRTAIIPAVRVLVDREA